MGPNNSELNLLTNHGRIYFPYPPDLYEFQPKWMGCHKSTKERTKISKSRFSSEPQSKHSVCFPGTLEASWK